MKYALLLCVLLAAPWAAAQDVTLQWNLPTTDCNGDPQPVADELEIFVADAPIPSANTPCVEGADPRPAGNNIVMTAQTTNAGTGQLDISLLGGRTYFVRARLRVGDDWSNLSGQIEVFVPKGVLQVPVIIQIGG